MRKRTRYLPLRAFTLLGLCVLLSAAARAQVKFVQISDPHVFDDARQDTDNRLDNKAALASCVAKINQRVADEGAYDFVVVTGDLGIEGLLQGVDEANNEAVDGRLRSGAAELAPVLALSKVRRWLFVPGNNDVVGEEPHKVRYYHLFLEALSGEIRKTADDFNIIDLCPKDPAAGGSHDSQARLYQLPGKPDYAFIGFDNASFKNAPGRTPKRIESNFELQQRHVSQVAGLLDKSAFRYAYVFYHIPEVDDPHLAPMGDEQEDIKARRAEGGLTGGRYERSAWFVRDEVREAWERVVMSTKVYGLFAGHFHDPQQKTYRNFEKLHVCPPLALKFQNDAGGRARGFQEVYIDGAGAVSTRVDWLAQAGWSPAPVADAAAAASLRQYELGQTYESEGRFKEAEAAYLKAAESDWPPARQRALASLKQVVALQESWYEKYFVAPLGTASSAGATAVFTVFPTFLLVLAVYLSMKLYGKWKGKYQLRIGPIVTLPRGGAGTGFEQVAKTVHGRMMTHYRRRRPFFPAAPSPPATPRLPMLASSLSKEVADIVESSLPGVLGKLMAWLIRRTDRPRYSIEGVMYSDYLWGGHGVPSSLSLTREGEPLQSWDDEPPVNELIARHRRVAFEALRRLVWEMNR